MSNSYICVPQPDFIFWPDFLLLFLSNVSRGVNGRNTFCPSLEFNEFTNSQNTSTDVQGQNQYLHFNAGNVLHILKVATIDFPWLRISRADMFDCGAEKAPPAYARWKIKSCALLFVWCCLIISYCKSKNLTSKYQAGTADDSLERYPSTIWTKYVLISALAFTWYGMREGSN